MEIQANCVYDYNAIKALTRYSAFSSVISKIALGFIAMVGLSTIWNCLSYLLYWGFDGSIVFYLLLMIGMLGGYVWLIVRLPRRQYKNMGTMADGTARFVFGETGYIVDFQSIDGISHSEQQYTGLVKVFDTPNYLFLLRTKNQAYIVDKSTFSGGTVEALRAKLQPMLGKKYIIKKR